MAFSICRLNRIKGLSPARWRSGYSFFFIVGRSGVYFPSRVIPKDFKKSYSQLPCLALSTKRDSVENKPASLFVVSLSKTLNEMSPSLCGKQVVGPSNLPVVVDQSNWRLAKGLMKSSFSEKLLKKRKILPIRRKKACLYILLIGIFSKKTRQRKISIIWEKRRYLPFG